MIFDVVKHEKFIVFIYNEKSNVNKRGEIMMIFKVYYQANATEVPIRENTKTIYVEAESVRQVRHIVKKRTL